jgi:hypothetical protein
MQLAATVDSRRLVLTAGTFTILDLFDRSAINFDPRQTFMNMEFMTHASWDFAADARGYSLGGVAELYWDDWVLRFGRMAPPLNPNQLPIDVNLAQVYADALEVEHDHSIFGRAGAIKIVAYRNHEVMGRFDDAIAVFRANPSNNAANCPSTVFSYASGDVTAPALCYVRRPNTKVGIGLNIEQHLADDFGLVFRAMYSDGQSEVDAFNSADRDLSLALVGKGTFWHRPFDVAGVGLGGDFVSSIHAQYLAMGGEDGFVGDGRLPHAAPETVAEAFYSVNLLKAVWLTADYQEIWNPGFNSDRGPVAIVSGRVHAEF